MKYTIRIDNTHQHFEDRLHRMSEAGYVLNRWQFTGGQFLSVWEHHGDWKREIIENCKSPQQEQVATALMDALEICTKPGRTQEERLEVITGILRPVLRKSKPEKLAGIEPTTTASKVTVG